jgi:hypothetical protein
MRALMVLVEDMATPIKIKPEQEDLLGPSARVGLDSGHYPQGSHTLRLQNNAAEWTCNLFR